MSKAKELGLIFETTRAGESVARARLAEDWALLLIGCPRTTRFRERFQDWYLGEEEASITEATSCFHGRSPCLKPCHRVLSRSRHR
jgi:hypothetical protein